MGFSAVPKRRSFFVIVSILIGFVCAAFLTEGLVRIFYDVPPGSRRFVIDSGFGVRANAPNVVRRKHYPGVFDVTISTNSAGMRGVREYALKKPGKVERILMLGDSFVFGVGVEDDEVVSSVLESILNEGSGSGVEYEVINLAVAGFGQAEELVTYTELGRNYDPDAVVMFYFNNDIANNAFAKLFEVVDIGSVRRTETDYLPAMGARKLIYSFGVFRWLAENSRAWRLVREKVSYLVQQTMLKEQGLQGFSDTNTEVLTLAGALVLQFIKDVQADGARPIVVIIPYGKDITSNFPLDAESVEKMGADFVDGRDYYVEDDYFIEGHWNVTGHRKTAERLAELLKE